MAPIYRASGALFPSIYISQAPASAEQRRATVLSHVAAEVNASARLADAGGPRVPVYPFAWQCYHNGSTLLSYDDLQSEIIEPYNAGADGVVVWGCKPQTTPCELRVCLSECANVVAHRHRWKGRRGWYIPCWCGKLATVSSLRGQRNGSTRRPVSPARSRLCPRQLLEPWPVHVRRPTATTIASERALLLVRPGVEWSGLQPARSQKQGR